MSKNDKDRLVDKVMGEADMTLLEADDNVSFDALIGQLQDNLHDETDYGRREAFRTAINGYTTSGRALMKRKPLPARLS